MLQSWRSLAERLYDALDAVVNDPLNHMNGEAMIKARRVLEMAEPLVKDSQTPPSAAPEPPAES